MDQDAKAGVQISKYTHKLTNKPPVVAATRQKWYEKEKLTIEQQVRNLYHRRFVAFDPLIGQICVLFVECELRYVLVSYVTFV